MKTIADYQAAYASGREVREVMRELWERIAGEPDEGIFITKSPWAWIEAQVTELDGKSELPLYGIPFAVKDNIDVAGLPTTAACPAFAYEPAESAPVVRLLQEAGAICVGKTNLDQFATGLVGVRTPYPVPKNAFDPEYLPGGSSSGSAVAVAKGLAVFSLGTDTAGSGRVPAAFNELVGLKPTRGYLSTRGVVDACKSLDCVSIFAHSCAEAERVLRLVAQSDEEEAWSRTAPSLWPTFRRRFRFGVPKAEELDYHAWDAAADLFAEAVKQLEALGGEAVEI
ncbi:MAG: amidase family protein, partial [Verrucomicrobiales bacterium]